MEHGIETAVAEWTAPQCPFRIEYSARALDDIRLAVVDAFFSLPRGGAEIGGILLGQHDAGRVLITGFEALDCEHATGPSFTLSARDQTLLAEMTAVARRNPSNLQPVGWYHSHTRSEIFLSDTDQDIHNRFFPEPWQVALVLKPHTFEPTRAGFFFRERDGSIRGAASYREFRLDPMPLRPGSGNGSGSKYRSTPADSGGPAIVAAPEPAPADPPPAKGKGPVPITREVAVDPPPATANGQQAFAESAGFDAPDFGQSRQERSWRGFKAAAILAIGLAAGGVGYQTREYWLPQVLTKARAVLPREPDSYVSLAVQDENGQLKIRWDRNAPAVRNALEATLQITDGNTMPQVVRLDSEHLAAGSFTYERQNERVDVNLIASEPGGGMVKEQTSFLGRLPAQRGAASDPQAAKDRDDDAQRADKLQKDLNLQAAKTRKLEKDLKDVREQLEKGNPTADPTKKE
jgi:proteasome lid subunit RPN8/RPN11